MDQHSLKWDQVGISIFILYMEILFKQGKTQQNYFNNISTDL